MSLFKKYNAITDEQIKNPNDEYFLEQLLNLKTRVEIDPDNAVYKTQYANLKANLTRLINFTQARIEQAKNSEE